MNDTYELTLTDSEMEVFYRAFAIDLPARVKLPYSGRRLHTMATGLLGTIGFWAYDSTHVYADTVDPMSGKALQETVEALAPLVKSLCKAAVSDGGFSRFSEGEQKVLRRVADAGLFKHFP